MKTSLAIRAATSADVPDCVRLIEARRQVYASYEPRFWNKSEHSAALSSGWFAKLFGQSETISFVAEENGAVVGFLIATNAPAPPVYKPGGPTALIDDFAVVSDDRWDDIGNALFNAARVELKARGFAQLVVVGAHKDLAKTAFLESTNLSLASTWWTAGV